MADKSVVIAAACAAIIHAGLLLVPVRGAGLEREFAAGPRVVEVSIEWGGAAAEEAAGRSIGEEVAEEVRFEGPVQLAEEAREIEGAVEAVLREEPLSADMARVGEEAERIAEDMLAGMAEILATARAYSLQQVTADESGHAEAEVGVEEVPVASGVGVQEGSRAGEEAEGTPAGVTLEGNALPRYPLLALRRRMEGRVVVEVVVSRDGSAEEVLMVESSGHRVLDNAVVRAVGRWKFDPATVAGRRVEGRVRLPFRFVLEEGGSVMRERD